MAADTNARLQYSLLDGRTIRSTLEIPAFIDGAQTATQMKTAWTAQLALLEAITGGQVVGGEVSVVMAKSATGGRPTADSRAQEVGVFQEGNASSPSVFGIAVPTLLDTVLTTDRTKVDVANTDIVAWRASLLAAVLGGHYSNREYEPLTYHVGTLVGFRKYRKRASAIGRTKG